MVNSCLTLIPSSPLKTWTDRPTETWQAPSVACAGFSQRPSEEFPTEIPHLRVASCMQPLDLNNDNNYTYNYNNNSNNNANIYKRLTSTKSVLSSTAVLVRTATGIKSVFKNYCFISMSRQFQMYRPIPQIFSDCYYRHTLGPFAGILVLLGFCI